jgi:membrane-bound ClpP family serine protease
VFIEGETWNAVSNRPVEKGQPVRVVSMTGLTLKVEPQ